MSTAAVRVSPSEFAAWGRDDPDLELDQDGRIRSIATERPEASRGGAIGSAVPAALGMILSNVGRWD